MSINIYPQTSDSMIPSSSHSRVVENGRNSKFEQGEAVRRPFSPTSEKYIRKLDRLVKIYEKISEKNDKLRYHIVKVKEEVNKLLHTKRHLCCRLSSFNDAYMDENLEIPDTNNRDANFEKLIGDVITSTEPIGPPASKKRRIVEPKKPVAAAAVVVVAKPNVEKQNSEEPEAREAINRILNDAKSLMKQQQREQEEYTRQQSQAQKRTHQQQGAQMNLIRQQQQQQIQAQSTKNSETKGTPANESGSYSAPVIQGNHKPSSTGFLPGHIQQQQPSLNRTMSTPTTTQSQNHGHGNQQANAPQFATSGGSNDGKQVYKSSLPLPQTPGVYILAHGQQLIKQPQHIQNEMMSMEVDKPNTSNSGIQKSSSQPYIVSHHDLPPKNNSDQKQMPQQYHIQYPSGDGQKGGSSQPQILIHRYQQQSNAPNNQQQPQKGQQQHPQPSQIQILSPGPKGPPLHAQITSQPLPTGSQPSGYQQIVRVRQQSDGTMSSNEYSQQPQNIQMEQVKLYYTPRQLQDPSTINPQLLPHRQMNAQRLQMEQQVKERERMKQQQQLEGGDKNEKGSSAPQSQHQQQGMQQGMQQIVIQQSGQQMHQQIHSQPRLREALQNAGNGNNDPQQRQQQHIQFIQGVPTNMIQTQNQGAQRIITSSQKQQQQIPKNMQQQNMQMSSSPQQQQQQNNVYLIDSSRCIRLASRDSLTQQHQHGQGHHQLVGVQADSIYRMPFNVSGGTQAIRYYLPQNIATATNQQPQQQQQGVTITSSPQKPLSSSTSSQNISSKNIEGKFDRLLRASSIDHLLPDAPDNDNSNNSSGSGSGSNNKNDDNIDWSIYEEPKPKSSPRKAPTPRKRGAAIKVDSNSDAMARISPILAQFKQEMAQSTVAQEQQHQQALTMAARNANKVTPIRARKRPTKAEKDAKEAAAAAKSTTSQSGPASVTSNQGGGPSSVSSTTTDPTPVAATTPIEEQQQPIISDNLLQLPIEQTGNSKESAMDILKKIPTIIVTAATPEPNKQKIAVVCDGSIVLPPPTQVTQDPEQVPSLSQSQPISTEKAESLPQ